MTQRTLTIIKPDSVENGNTGRNCFQLTIRLFPGTGFACFLLFSSGSFSMDAN